MPISDKPVAYIINEGVADCVSCDVIRNDNGFLVAECTLQQAMKLNRNRRYYTEADLRKEIYSDRIRELVSTGNFKGEAGHPLDMNLARQQKVDPTLEQVWYTKLWMDGDFVKAHVRGTNNELGRAFNEDLKAGQKPSYSLRSLGSIKIVNGQSNVTNLRIVTYDRVYYPSYDNAYTNRIISESAGFEGDSLDHMITSKGNRQIVKEGFEAVAPVMNQDVVNLLIKESYSFYQICNDFSPIYKSITLSEDKKSVTMVTESYETIVVPLGRFVENQIDKFCQKYS